MRWRRQREIARPNPATDSRSGGLARAAPRPLGGGGGEDSRSSGDVEIALEYRWDRALSARIDDLRLVLEASFKPCRTRPSIAARKGASVIAGSGRCRNQDISRPDGIAGRLRLARCGDGERTIEPGSTRRMEKMLAVMEHAGTNERGNTTWDEHAWRPCAGRSSQPHNC